MSIENCQIHNFYRNLKVCSYLVRLFSHSILDKVIVLPGYDKRVFMKVGEEMYKYQIKKSV